MIQMKEINLFKENGDWNWEAIEKIRLGETFTGITTNNISFKSQAWIAGLPYFRLPDHSVVTILNCKELRQITQVF